jgi:hypothetical protein
MGTCANCGKETAESDVFCRFCGARLSPEDEEDDKFVIQKGTARLDTELNGPEPPKPAPKRLPKPAAAAEEPRAKFRKAKTPDPEDGAPYVYPDEKPKKKGKFKRRFISLLILVILIAAAVGAVRVYDDVRTQAFRPVQDVYAAFTTQTTAYLGGIYYPDFYEALTQDGYMGINGYWKEKRSDWGSVYGSSLIATPKIKSAEWIRGRDKDAYVQKLNDEYGVSPDISMLFHMTYTVSVSGSGGTAELTQDTYVGRVGDAWYLFQQEF